jgi:hypothetical protein
MSDRSVSGEIVMILVGVAFLFAFAFMGFAQGKKVGACEARGGEWMADKCIVVAREIPD